MKNYIWQKISFNDNWAKCDTSILDDLAPSWYKRRGEFNEASQEYKDFIERLKRRQAIETGAIENLYDVKRGITENLVVEGLNESLLSHGDISITNSQFMSLVRSQYDAVDYIFQLISNKNDSTSLDKKTIRELHQLITEHQSHTDAIDEFGNKTQITLLKGEFKKFPNNPKRGETTYYYCPPEQVESEIESLVDIYSLEEEKIIKGSSKKTHPIILSSWLHHAFTQIHPFQDGNGRVARLLASFVLIKFNLFPFSIGVNQKSKYIQVLEEADNGNPQGMVDFFAFTQKRNIELALNLNNIESSSNYGKTTQEVILEKIRQKRNQKIESLRLEYQNQIAANRRNIYQLIYSSLGERYNNLSNKLNGIFNVKIGSTDFEEEKSGYNNAQIIKYARVHDYFVKLDKPRAWFRLSILNNTSDKILDESSSYNLFFTLHHYGYTDASLSIGAWLESRQDEETTIIPVEVSPLTLTLEEKITNPRNINLYLDDIITRFLDWVYSNM